MAAPAIPTADLTRTAMRFVDVISDEVSRDPTGRVNPTRVLAAMCLAVVTLSKTMPADPPRVVQVFVHAAHLILESLTGAGIIGADIRDDDSAAEAPHAD